MDIREKIEKRALKAAETILQTKGTIRSTAEILKVSRTTIHNDLTKILPQINGELHRKVMELFEINTKERHIRGAIATKKAWEKKQKEGGSDD